MEKLVTSHRTLGILGGGQLGKLLCLSASSWDVQTVVMDASADAPARSVCTRFVQGDPKNEADVLRFGKDVELLTVETDHVHAGALAQLERSGKRVYPRPASLEIIQDKGLQKEFYAKRGYPTPPFWLLGGRQELAERIRDGALTPPLIVKLRRGGYDGKGVFLVASEADTAHVPDEPVVVEPKVDIACEIAVIAARNSRGETACHPAVEMVFDPRAHLVDYLLCPARVDAAAARRASEIAASLASDLEIEGILAVEFFLESSGRLWVNEASPRPHNSGHHTIESAWTSQYEQHLRGIFGMPLGSTRLRTPSAMINLLGEPGHAGSVRYEGLTEALRLEGVKLHVYGKKETRPFRKMGHLTVMHEDLWTLQRRVEELKRIVRVVT